MWSIIVALLIGLVVGAVARLILPGDQNLAWWETMLIGALGATIGSWLAAALLNAYGTWIPLLVGVLVAMGLIILYQMIRGRRTAAPTV